MQLLVRLITLTFLPAVLGFLACAVPAHSGTLATSSFGATQSAATNAASKNHAMAKHAFVQWVAENQNVTPGAQVLTGIWVQLEPGWHIYWKNPGDAGLPMRLQWKLPEGFTLDSLQWPTPDTISAPPLMNYGYGGTVILPVYLHVSTAFTGKASFSAQAKWLICQEICLPEEADLELELTVSQPGTQIKPSLFATDLQRAVDQLPWVTPPWPIEVSMDNLWVNLHVTPGQTFSNENGLWFFPESGDWMDHAAPESLWTTTQNGKTTYSLRLKRLQPGGALPQRLRGLLASKSPMVPGKLPRAFGVDLVWPHDVGSAPENQTGGKVEILKSESAPPSLGGFWNLFVKLGLAFAGGLILNLMPCVLPVLSLKVFDFVQRAGHARWKVFAHGLTFTLGVLASFWVLAGLLLILRQGGEKLGWGYQLQSPPFLVLLCALFFFFSLNLFGVFEMGYFFTRLGQPSGKGSSGHLASFLAGVTATVVATPCTAPFMGSAMGFAFTQSAWVALLVFTFVGMGMASPYLLLSGFPGLMRILPKPGEWMEHLKQFMGFPLLGTAIWLAWILGRQAGLEALIALLAVLLLAGISAWVLGKWAALHREKPVRIIAILVALVVFVPAFVMVLLFVQQSTHGNSRGTHLSDLNQDSSKSITQGVDWEPYNAQKAEQWIAEGKPVFIDFTADWCLSCKVNERVALENQEVKARFAQLGVSLMKGDWTRSDPGITQALAGYGRQSVPLYVFFPGPNKERMQILPEILTPSILLEALDSIPKPGISSPKPNQGQNRGIL